MLLKVDVYYIPTTVSLAVITLILGVSVVASILATRGQPRRTQPVPENPPFRVADEAEMAAVSSVWHRGTRSEAGRQ
jgi:tellurite resistance protein TerC